MLNFHFKRCCQNCGEIEVDYDVLTKQYLGKEPTKDYTVHCFHEKVCKKYEECDEIWPNQT